MLNRLSRVLAVLVVGCVAAHGANADMITWQPSVVPISSASDIVNVGAAARNITFEFDSPAHEEGKVAVFAPYGAINFPDDATVNGVIFTGTNVGDGIFWPATGDSELDKVLGYHFAVRGAVASTAPWNVRITGLKENTQYLIQIIGIHDNRTVAGINVRQYAFQDVYGGPLSPILQRGTGGSVIGTFTTGSGETTFAFQGLVQGSSKDPGVAAIVVRVIPEPATAGLLSLGGLLLLRRRR